jgi:hypothetical protein
MRLFLRRNPTIPFATYIQEILAIEGFLGYDVVDLTDRRLTPDLLEGPKLVMVAHMPLEKGEQKALADYVGAGGGLIALRPPAEMAPLFGAESFGTTLKRGHYLQLDEAACPPGAYSTDIPLQVHAEADCYRVKEAEVMAWFCFATGARRDLPAVTLHAGGDGLAAMFAFDLSHSTVFFHQGLPEQASTGGLPDPSGLGQYKPDNHFVGFLDVTRATLPQADLQQRLLGALVDRMLPAPVPRLWYFPEGAPCLAFLNGDSDAMSLADLETCLEIIEARGGYYTCYVMEEGALDPRDEATLRARGHSFGRHIWAGNMPTPETMAAAVQEQIAGYRRRYGYTPLTNRGHCLIWPGWTEMAQFLAEAGVRMDSNFVGMHCGHGYLSGSGLPVKFMDARGSLINLYEQSTQWEDDVALASYAQRLPYTQAVAMSLQTLRDAQERFHTVVNFNFHPIHTRQEWLNTREWITAVAEHCWEQHIPMVSGDAWARFNDARRRVMMSDYAADAPAGRVRWTLMASEPTQGLTLSLPAAWEGATLQSVMADGNLLPLRRIRFHEADRVLAWLNLGAGERKAVEVEYGE